MNDFAEIIIIGGGFTGAALAYALADGKRRIVVYEARTTAPNRFAGELIHPGRLAVLDKALVDRLRARGADVTGFAVVAAPTADRPESTTLLPYHETPTHAQPGLGIEHQVMVDELRAAAAERPRVEFRYGVRAEVRFVDGVAVGVRGDDGSELDAKLVLGAEGRHSQLRGQLGLPTDARIVSFTAALRVPHGVLPNRGYGHVFLGGPGPILAYPISATALRMCFDLPSADRVRAEDLRAQIEQKFAPFVPAPLQSALLEALKTETPQLVANHSISTKQCVAPGVALVGDAGGCAHPLTAAGMSVCLNDIGLLRDVVDRFGDTATVSPETLVAGLRRFESERYRFVRVRETLTDGLYRLFEHDGPSGPALREALFSHWRKNRADSVSLLACESSDPRLLQSEWGRVAARALFGIARGNSGPRGAALFDLAAFAGVELPKLLRVS